MSQFMAPLAVAGPPSPKATEALAVLAVVSGEGEREAAELAQVVSEKLGGRVEVMAVGEMVERFGGAGVLTGDIERLRGIFQQAYLQSYSFKYDAAIRNLEQVLEGLDRVPDNQARWDLWVQANVYLGKTLADKGDKSGALKVFYRVLRNRNQMQLTRKEHSPKTIALWEKARKDLVELPSGKVEIEAEPRVSEVYLDGVRVGQTPLSAYFPRGRYLLKVASQDAGSAYRWIEVGEQDVKVRLKLAFEGAIELNLAHPAVRLPRGKESLPRHWWAWLSERLRVAQFVAVKRMLVDNHWRCSAALVDGQSGRVLREGWLESSGKEKEHLAVDAIDLANFLATGKAGKRVVETVPGKPGASEKVEPSGAAPVAVVTRTERPRPFYRKWWPASLAGAVFVGGGAVALFVSLDYAEAGGLKAKQAAADTWMGVAVAGFALGAALVVAGIISDLTFDPADQPYVTVTPVVSPGGLGVGLSGRF